MLAVKSQNSARALDDLAACAPPEVPVVLAQNGVDNERQALRRFANVYAMCVMLPATHLDAGVVAAHSAPTTGILDIGRYPAGADEVAGRVAADLSASAFSSRAEPAVMARKYTKLLMNLGNAVTAACGPDAAVGDLVSAARREGVACLRAAGIPFATREEDAARRGDVLTTGEVDGMAKGGSSWQSLARGTGTIETDHLNGEIVLLGRLHGVPTPVNEALQRVASRLARENAGPGSMNIHELSTLVRG